MAKEKSSSGEPTPTKVSTKSKKTASQSRLKVVTSSSGHAVPRTGPSLADLDQEIRVRAFELYCERGGEHGAHEDDWHRAEQEVLERYREKYEYGT